MYHSADQHNAQHSLFKLTLGQRALL